MLMSAALVQERNVVNMLPGGERLERPLLARGGGGRRLLVLGLRHRRLVGAKPA